MNTITLQATIKEADFPTFLSLFEKFKVKTVLLSKKEGKKTYPIETAIPNEETHNAFLEVKEKGHLMKRYKDVRQLFKDIDDEQL
ncbi:antitoxin [Capnocytophaga sp. HP1101]